MRDFCFKELAPLNEVFASFQERNHFGLIWDLVELFKPKELPNKLGWTRISTKGKLGLSDYNCGLYCVTVRLSGQARYIGEKGDKNLVVDYFVRFHVGNADDSSWGAWSQPYKNREECLKQVYKTAEILKDLVDMPNEEDLNIMLRPFGLFGEFES